MVDVLFTRHYPPGEVFSRLREIPLRGLDWLRVEELPLRGRALNAEMTEGERRFLISVKEGVPQWELLGLSGIEALPAIQWKVTNVTRMDRAKHADMLAKLRAKLRL